MCWTWTGAAGATFWWVCPRHHAAGEIEAKVAKLAKLPETGMCLAEKGTSQTFENRETPRIPGRFAGSLAIRETDVNKIRQAPV
jgi:hypothetical protein